MLYKLILSVPLLVANGVFAYFLVKRYVFHLSIEYKDNPRRIYAPFILHLSVLVFFLMKYPDASALWALRLIYALDLGIMLYTIPLKTNKLLISLMSGFIILTFC